MSTFASKSSQAPVASPDPSKHVNYTVGMVLGVDDFTQEFAYLSGRDQWMARDLIGYGTVCGLQVKKEMIGDEPQIVVTPGVALSPRGQLIHVTPAQCAPLNQWLSAHMQEVLDAYGSPPLEDVGLYVVLRYRECKTDREPIPGEPCRAEDEAMAPSRVMDDFKLELSLEAPAQLEEDAVREFVAWLGQIETTLMENEATPLDQFAEAVRGALVIPDSPPAVRTAPLFGSPPSYLKVLATDVCEYIRTAFRVWTTELRPLVRTCWLSLNTPCSEPSKEAESELYGELLLAQVSAALTSEMAVKDLSAIEINEDRRPFVIHLRMLEEMLICGRMGIGGGSVWPSGGMPVGTGMEANLTRIVALSWKHGGSTRLEIQLDDEWRKALVVGFGKKDLSDEGGVLVRDGSLDRESFQIFAERHHRKGDFSWFDYIRVDPDEIVGVEPVCDENGIITRAKRISAGGPAKAAAFVFTSAAFNSVWGEKLKIVMRGDSVCDESGERSIDAEFLRGKLPTGDRPQGLAVGIQGGRFESRVLVETKLNINTATVEELTVLGGVAAKTAAQIIDARNEHGVFKSMDELLGTKLIGEKKLNQIKPFITVG